MEAPELASDELVRALRPPVTGYQAWLDAQQARLTKDTEVARYTPAGEHAMERAREVVDRLDRAIELLRRDGIAREAFRFANQAMALQRVRSELVRARLAEPGDACDQLLARLGDDTPSYLAGMLSRPREPSSEPSACNL